LKIKLLVIGKTDEKSIQTLIDKYTKRIQAFISFDFIVIPDIKNTKKLSESLQKQKEGDLILSKINKSDFVILLDEKGQELTSQKFANFLQKKMNAGIKNLIFVVGGPYGFSDEVYKRANQKIALSQMTFSHQLVRVVFTEQLYRALTIINNHPYHHN
jgi:23S rRNA (pseudouridine1915-N3)-methyltransferase